MDVPITLRTNLWAKNSKFRTIVQKRLKEQYRAYHSLLRVLVAPARSAAGRTQPILSTRPLLTRQRRCRLIKDMRNKTAQDMEATLCRTWPITCIANREPDKAANASESSLLMLLAAERRTAQKPPQHQPSWRRPNYEKARICCRSCGKKKKTIRPRTPEQAGCLPGPSNVDPFWDCCGLFV